jgi:hypothetical protein
MGVISCSTSILDARETLIIAQGLGIRSLQQRGEHRRKRKENNIDAEDEQWKRAFWYGGVAQSDLLSLSCL